MRLVATTVLSTLFMITRKYISSIVAKKMLRYAVNQMLGSLRILMN